MATQEVNTHHGNIRAHSWLEKRPRLAAFSRQKNNILRNQESVAGAVVLVEPVSALNSLLTGKNTGKFMKSGPVSIRQWPESAHAVRAFDAIP